MSLRHFNRARRPTGPLAGRAGALRRPAASSKSGWRGGTLARFLGLLLLQGVCCGSSAFAADQLNLPGQTDLTRLHAQVESLRREVAQLREESSALQKQHASLLTENQTLRRALVRTEVAVRPPGVITNAPAGALPAPNPGAVQTATTGPEQADGRALTHWLSTADGKRHTRQCRFYKRTVGRPCDEAEGSLCVFCGE